MKSKPNSSVGIQGHMWECVTDEVTVSFILF